MSGRGISHEFVEFTKGEELVEYCKNPDAKEINLLFLDIEMEGMNGLETVTMPEINQPIMNRVAYHIRTGKHDVTDFDWENYIKFADKWLK